MASQAKTGNDLKSVRDTIESIWIAIVLAFVLRAFVVEAFVIPTGSMAPTLLGQHYALQCPACGYQFAFGPGEPDVVSEQGTIRAQALCANCGNRFSGEAKPSSGDRVLVMKYIYQFEEPRRWDVVVFKNPQNNRQNYIKRLIGLPGEYLEVVRGDIYTRKAADPRAPMKVQRKTAAAQESMWQPVYDNDFPPDPNLYNADAKKGYRQAPKWEPAQAGLWNTGLDNGRIFEFRGGDKPADLEFRAPRVAFLPHYAYNQIERELDDQYSSDNPVNTDRDVVTDLKLSLVVIPGPKPSTVTLLLTSFDHQFKGVISTEGRASLYYRPSEQAPWQSMTPAPVQIAPLQPGRGYTLALTHADLHATLWLDGRPLLETNDKVYRETYGTMVARVNSVTSGQLPRPQVRIQAQGGACQLRHVKVMRDVYYTTPRLSHSVQHGPLTEFMESLNVTGSRGWGSMGTGITLSGGGEQKSDLDEFFVLGDNSPQSLDSRAWTQAAPNLRLFGPDGEQLYHLGTVPRYNMIGRAWFVYWPAGYGLSGLPIVPNVGRMRLIR